IGTVNRGVLADKQLVLMLAGSPAGHERVERYTTGRHVDGVLFASLHGADPLPAKLAALGIPVVCSGRPLDGSDVPYIDVDQVGGVTRAVRHLIDGGRRRIATIAGPQDMVAGIERLAGYRDTVAAAGLPEMVAVGDFTRESGAAAMRELLAAHPDLDAVFAASDLMAHAALRTLREAGRRVPDDVAVIGFDDIETAAYTDPPLTTVRQPILELGRQGTRLLLRLAAGEPVEPALILPTELVIRESA
ncbi:substrate-binding domain-containing protein, partial [Micromonospora sp. NPDC051296]|uniref:LacI family DNA-binding transcriptional regulator n=1 Tax=Micromonospora sp. NPDC051296 TaxID=3155046 RepID=UPI00343D76D6